jgi:hypothetical protein
VVAVPTRVGDRLPSDCPPNGPFATSYLDTAICEPVVRRMRVGVVAEDWTERAASSCRPQTNPGVATLTLAAETTASAFGGSNIGDTITSYTDAGAVIHGEGSAQTDCFRDASGANSLKRLCPTKFLKSLVEPRGFEPLTSAVRFLEGLYRRVLRSADKCKKS